MKAIVSKFILAWALILGFTASGINPSHAQGCLNAAQARQAVSSGQAAPLSRVSSRVMRQAGGEVVGANLCRRGGRLVYIITVLRANGSARRVVADARSGRIVGR